MTGSILHGKRTGRDLATQQISACGLKLAAVGALRILEHHQVAPGAFAAHEHTPFRSMARRYFNGFHDTTASVVDGGKWQIRAG